MKLRPPAIPLITVDPYFSVWSFADHLTDQDSVHWTGAPNTIWGIICIDNEEFAFWGNPNLPKLNQTMLTLDALSTHIVFQHPKVRLTCRFTSPLLLDDYVLMSRPVSFLELSTESLDGQLHEITVRILVSEELCLDHRGQSPVETNNLLLSHPSLSGMKMQNSIQNVLNHSGDEIRIDWGAFYLVVQNGSVHETKLDGMTALEGTVNLSSGSALYLFGYDDIDSIVYFDTPLKAYWRKEYQTIEEAFLAAYSGYSSILLRCDEFSQYLKENARRSGGEYYADLLLLAYRQVIAAHKLVIDQDSNILFISKECSTNGCAATVDVSYPSIPLFLLYNPELIKGMMRPILQYAESEAWIFEFAPHDVGKYPLLNGQVYAKDVKEQMPIEECGNLLIMMTAVCLTEKDASFAQAHLNILRKWASYLIQYGLDPGDQLCTDDFMGHLAHNCNLSLKAILGIGSFSILLDMLDRKDESTYFYKQAQSMACQWILNASNDDGSFRLAFDQPRSFSMKYNAIWDVLFGLNLFPKEALRSEFLSYRKHMNQYGLPLDNRSNITKSDWLVWCATLAETTEEFSDFIAPLWLAYHETTSRVPMSDRYDTITGVHHGFLNRSVQGGLFIKLLADSETLYYPQLN